MFNVVPSPFSDLVAVAVIFIIIAVIAFVISFFFQEKPLEEPEAPEIEEPPEEVVGEAAAEALGETPEGIEEKVLETIEKALPHEPVPEASIPPEPAPVDEILEEAKASPEAETAQAPPRGGSRSGGRDR